MTLDKQPIFAFKQLAKTEGLNIYSGNDLVTQAVFHPPIPKTS